MSIDMAGWDFARTLWLGDFQMNKIVAMTGVAVVAIMMTAGASYAAEAGDVVSTASVAPEREPTNQELMAEIQALKAQLQADEDKQQGDHSQLTGLSQTVSDTSWSFDNGRPTIKSGDGRFSMALRTRFQFDDANFIQHPGATSANRDLSSGAVIRRGFFGVEGTAFKDFWYEFRLNGGGSDGGSQGASGVPNAGEGDPLLSLARVAYRGIDHFQLNLGVIEPVFMYEGTVSSGQLLFMERPEIDNIAADSFGAGDARRGIEATFQHADFLHGGDNLVLSAAFTGNKTGSAVSHANGGDENSQVLGRASYRVWSDGISNASIGVSGAHAFSGGVSNGGGGTFRFRDRPEIRVDGTRLIDTGAITAANATMYAVDGGANIQNFYLGGEYAQFTIDRATGGHPQFSGGYVEGSWVLTGEPKTYTVSATNNEVGGFGSPKVGRPFSLDGDSWGAWELAVRYSDTNLNWHQSLTAGAGGVAGGEEKIWALGLNWYLNQNVKLQLNDNIVRVTKQSAAGPVFTQAGQNFNVVGLRLQFTN